MAISILISILITVLTLILISLLDKPVWLHLTLSTESGEVIPGKKYRIVLWKDL